MSTSCLLVAAVLPGCAARADSIRDPCVGVTYMDSLTNALRDPVHKPHPTARQLCDDDIDENVWYTFKKSPSMMLYSNCTHIENCGTYHSIWVNGSHPTESNPGPVELPVCVADVDTCCSTRWNWTVQVKWCQTQESFMYVYKLKSVPICDMAYCAYQAPSVKACNVSDQPNGSLTFRWTPARSMNSVNYKLSDGGGWSADTADLQHTVHLKGQDGLLPDKACNVSLIAVDERGFESDIITCYRASCPGDDDDARESQPWLIPVVVGVVVAVVAILVIVGLVYLLKRRRYAKLGANSDNKEQNKSRQSGQNEKK